jgi:hypothetical protein
VVSPCIVEFTKLLTYIGQYLWFFSWYAAVVFRFALDKAAVGNGVRNVYSIAGMYYFSQILCDLLLLAILWYCAL